MGAYKPSKHTSQKNLNSHIHKNKDKTKKKNCNSKGSAKLNKHTHLNNKRKTNELIRYKVTEIDSALKLLHKVATSSKSSESAENSKNVQESYKKTHNVSSGNTININSIEEKLKETNLNLRLMMNDGGGGAGTSVLQSDKQASTNKTAGLIIIGDEILKGQVLDTNSHFICKELYNMGVKVGRISVIGDGIQEIAQEVRQLSSKFDFVLTTGGIGPTHDDMTYVGVAKAFDEPVVLNEEMARMVDFWLGHRGFEKSVIMKMAEMPQSAKLLFDPNQQSHRPSFPIVNVHNVFVFPGIPQFLQKMFPRMKRILDERFCVGDGGGVGSISAHPFHFREIFIARDEMAITPPLNVAVEKFKDSVTFGSYPVIDNLYFSTRITMDSHSPDKIQEADTFLTGLLPPNSVISYDNQPLATAADKVFAIIQDKQHPLHQILSQAVSTIEEALEKFSLGNLCICFNGGKDCTALLHLAYAVIRKKLPENKDKLQALCILTDNGFPEMETFIRESSERYSLKLWTFQGPIQVGLRSAMKEHPEIKGVLMGTRRSDPSGKDLSYFKMTDPNWPQVMRISPMLDWDYEQVWSFLRSLTLPYCSLYDKGYTSIGSQSNTVPNPRLAYDAADGKKLYRPAYTLSDPSSERTGRQ